MMLPNPDPNQKKALLKAIKTLNSLPAQTVLYGSAMLAVASLGGIAIPGALGALATGVGINALSNILERVARGEQVPDDEIRQQVEAAIQNAGIEQLATSNEFQRAIAHIFRQFDLIKYAVQEGEYTIVATLSEQFAQHRGILDELKGDLTTVREQMETLATREQSETIIVQLQQIAERLQTYLPVTAQATQPGIRHLRIFAASPSDVGDERKRLKKVLDELNEPGGVAEQNGLFLQLWGWEQVVSGMGRAEDVILNQLPVEQWDIFVGILWMRFGAPTGNSDPSTGRPFGSGTEEEFVQAHQAWQQTGRPHILFYQRTSPPESLNDIDLDQLSKVRAFLQGFKTPTGHPGLFTNYTQPSDFEDRIRKDLTKLLPRLGRRPQQQPKLQAAPQPPANDHTGIQKAFLGWTQRTHNRLELRGIKVQGQLPTVPLDRVFVALKGDRSDPGETHQSRLLLEDELRIWEQRPEWQVRSLNEKRLLRWYVLAQSPYMLSLTERDRPSVLGERKVEVLNLAEAFRRHRWLVILGDPGSGKTTVARWLALHLTQACLQGEKRVLVPANHVDPNAPVTAAPVDLGPARMPVLLRVSDFAEARKDNPTLSLIDYLGFHPWLGERPVYDKNHPQKGQAIPAAQLNELIRHELNQNRVVIILDGLDEITRGIEREGIVRAIEAFIHDWVSTPGGVNPLDELEQTWRWQTGADLPAENGGNQLIVTSRIAGYHAFPLNGRLVHFTVEPMGNAAIDRFCESWSRAVHQLMAEREQSEAEIEERAMRQAEALKAAIHDPARPSVEEMASNPLLLTILALVHHNTQARLPEQRVRLYQIAVENLVEVWRDSGLTEDEVVNILGPVAAHIHSNYATGLIPEPEMHELVVRELARYKGIDPDATPPAFQETVDKFLEAVRDQVGILAARGDYLYGFLHLTFQEYLAARYLVRDSEKTLERILEKSADPRWREPILLALGYAVWTKGFEERERLLQSLLDAPDPFADLLPRNTLLLGAALPEFVHTSGKIVTQVTRRLLEAYADREGIGRFEFLRQQIERALLRIRRGEAIQPFDEVLVTTLKIPPNGGPALNLAAAALTKLGGWQTPALTDALLDVLPFENEAWDWPATRALQTIAVQNPSMLPARRIPLRQTLAQETVRTFITSDAGWRTILLFLCGGNGADGGFDPNTIYMQPAISKILEEALRLRKPANEMVDVFRNAWEDPATPSVQAAECIIGLVALNQEILPLVQAAADRPSHASEARRLLERLLATQGDAHDIHVVEQVVAACIPILCKSPDLIGAALDAARQLQNAYSRAQALNNIAPHLPAELQTKVFDEALNAARQIQDEDSRAQALNTIAPQLPTDLQAKVFGEALDAARQIQDEYFLSQALSTIAPNLPTNLLGQTLDAVLHIQNEDYRAQALGIIAPHLQADLLGQALDAARQLQNEYSRTQTLNTIAPHLPAELQAKVLAETLNATRQIQDEYSRAQALNTIAPHLSADLQAKVFGEAFDAVRQIQDEYSRALALRTIAIHLPANLQANTLGEALDAARQLQNPYSRALALSTLAPYLSAELLSKALDAALQLHDEHSRALVINTIIIYLPANLLYQALDAARQLQDENSRAQTLSTIAPHLPVDLQAKVFGEALEAARQLQDENSRTQALNTIAPHLSKHSMLWTAFWTQTQLDLARSRPYRIAEHAIEVLNPSLPWDLLRQPSKRTAALQRILETARKQDTLELTETAIQTLQGLAETNQAEIVCLCLRFGKLGKDVSVPAAWFSQPNTQLRELAVLLQAETRLSNVPDLDVLISLLAQENDRLRYRASKALQQVRSIAEVEANFAEGLIERARATSQPDIKNILYWSALNLKHNQPEALSIWLSKLEQDENARTIIEWIAKIDEPCWKVLLDFAPHATATASKTLAIAVWHMLRSGQNPKDYFEQHVTQLRQWAQGEDDTARWAIWALGYLPHTTDEELKLLQVLALTKNLPNLRSAAARALARLSANGKHAQQTEMSDWLRMQVQQEADAEEKARFGGAWLLQHILIDSYHPDFFNPTPWLTQLLDLFAGQQELMLDAALRAGADYHHWSDYHQKIVRIVQALVTESLLPAFMKRLEDGLSGEWWPYGRMVLACAAAVSEQMPAAFLRQANSPSFEQDLILTIKNQENFDMRRFAFSILSHLPQVSSAVMSVLHSAMRDVYLVQRDATQAVLNFRRIDGDLATALTETLYDPSAAVAYAGAQILEALGRSEMTPPEQRQQILLALATAIRDPRSRRDVHLWGGAGQNIRYAGQLDQVFHRALVAIAEGVRL